MPLLITLGPALSIIGKVVNAPEGTPIIFTFLTTGATGIALLSLVSYTFQSNQWNFTDNGDGTASLSTTGSTSGDYTFIIQAEDDTREPTQREFNFSVFTVEAGEGAPIPIISGLLSYDLNDYSSSSNIDPFPLSHWYVSFPRPQMGSFTKLATNHYKLSLAYATTEEPISLVWESTDSVDHPLNAYATVTDYTGYTWTFEVIVPENIKDFTEAFGLTLTVETGTGTHFVRVWNYADSGTSRNAIFTLDFSNIASGWEADTPFSAANVTRMYLTFTHVDYLSDTDFSESDYAEIEIRTISTTGSLSIRTSTLSNNRTGVALGYDDLYHISPDRIVEGLINLGYRGRTTIYIGMSHFMRLGWDAGESRHLYKSTFSSSPFNPPAEAWLTALINELESRGLVAIPSVSYELLNDYAPLAWRQLNINSNPALTGWDPPSTLLAPTNSDALDYLKGAAAQAASFFPAGKTAYLQIGEPWWWDGAFGDGKPCFYDAVTQALYTSETSETMYEFTDSDDDPDATPDATATAAWLNDKLGESTIAIRDHVKAQRPTEVGILFFTPQPFARELMRAVNYPVVEWAYTAFDFFQLEAYDEAIKSDHTDHNAQILEVINDLSYPVNRLEYFGGFVLNTVDADTQWPRIIDAMNFVRDKVTFVTVWSYSQVVRDGLILQISSYR